MPRGKAVVLAEKSVKTEENALRAKVDKLVEQNGRLSESLTQVQTMFEREDRGWGRNFFMAEGEYGLTLMDLREWGDQIRNAMVGNPLIKRGLLLRTSYIWQDGIQYRKGTIPNEGRGKGKNVQAVIDKPMNQRNFFGASARSRREASLYADGLAAYIGNDSTGILRAVPLRQLSADYRDPDFEGEVWAYRRTWLHFFPGDLTGVEQHRWYFTDEFAHERMPKINYGGVMEDVDQDHTIFVMNANGLDGMALGSPDALAALIWSRIARNAIMDGVTMTSAMATFAFKASIATKNAGANASMTLGVQGSAGQTAIIGGANDLTPMSSAGKGYEFESLEPLIGLIASSLDVSVEALTSKSREVKELSTLDLATRLAMELRRAEHVEFDKRILTWLGAKDAEVYFITLDDSSEIYRRIQAIVLLWNTGLYSAEETKEKLEKMDGKVTFNPVPDGVMLPNNKNSLPRLDVDTDGETPPAGPPAAPSPNAPGTAPSTAAPDQGQSNKSGGQSSSGNDINKKR